MPTRRPRRRLGLSSFRLRRFGTLPADWAATLRNRWFADSAQEGDGFEPSVPRSPVSSVPLLLPARERRRFICVSSALRAIAWSRGTRNPEGSLRRWRNCPQRETESPAPRAIASVSDDVSKPLPISRGTKSSNPSPSCAESASHRFLSVAARSAGNVPKRRRTRSLRFHVRLPGRKI
jgi:hypothetical protein